MVTGGGSDYHPTRRDWTVDRCPEQPLQEEAPGERCLGGGAGWSCSLEQPVGAKAAGTRCGHPGGAALGR